MRAMVTPQFGGPDLFEERDVERPHPGPARSWSGSLPQEPTLWTPNLGLVATLGGSKRR